MLGFHLCWEFHLYSGDCGSHFKRSLNRDRLCCQPSQRSSLRVKFVCSFVHFEVQSLYACMLGFHHPSGDHHAHFTRSGKQSENACMLVCRDFICTLEIITRTLCKVVNRERLCDTNAFYFSHFRFVCLFVCWYKTRNSILQSLCLEGSNNPWE